MATSRGALGFLSPEWVVRDDGACLAVESILSARLAKFDGAVRRAILDGQASLSPTLRTMAALDPTIGDILGALAEGPPTPWNRAALLRGGGYRQLFIELTARCNEKCGHCYAESSPERHEELPLDVCLAVLDDAKSLGFKRVQLTGGDPLIVRHVVRVATRVRELGFEGLEIYTNGLALVGDTFERLRVLEPEFAFSFYSHDSAVHDEMTRTPGSQVRTLRAMERTRAAGLSTRVGVIVTEANLRDAEATLEFLRSFGFDEGAIGLDVARGVGRGVYTAEIESLKQSLRTKQSGGAGHRVDTGDTRFEGTACVSSDGAVYPCIFSRHARLGNVLERRLAEILTADEPVNDPEALSTLSEWNDRLTCFNCRVRAALHVPASPRAGALRVIQATPP